MQPLRAPSGWLIAREGAEKRGSLVCVVPNCLVNSRRLTLGFRLPHGRGTSRAACSEGSGIMEVEMQMILMNTSSLAQGPWPMAGSPLLLTLKSITLAHRYSKET